MEVREGYKLTEVGVIPEDWDLKSYDDIFIFLSTATYSRSQLSSHEQVQYLHYGDIHTKFDFHLDFYKHTLPTVSEELANRYPKLKNGDVVMADASEDYLGICKSVEIQNIDERKAIAGLHTFLLRDSNSTFINGFKGYLSSSSLLKTQFDQYATGMKVYGVSKTNLKKILIPIPPKPEQQAIAQALSDTDALIDALEQLITKKRNIKQGAMQELLTGKRRLPGFEVKQGYKQTEIGEIPEDWGTRELRELGDISTGSTPPTADSSNYGNDYLFVSPADLGDVKWIQDTEKKLSKKGFLISRIFPKNSILFTCIGSTIGKSGIASIDLTSNQQINAIYPSSNYNTEYVYYALQIIVDKIRSQAGEQAVPMINKSSFSEFQIMFPSISEQQAIATILSDMDTEIEALEVKLEKTREIKEGMMQELLTGKIRLVQAQGDHHAL